MKHCILDDTYMITDDTGKNLLTIKLNNEFSGNQITIETNKEVYSGPIDLISFSK